MFKKFIWVCTQLYVGQACGHFFLIIKYLHHVLLYTFDMAVARVLSINTSKSILLWILVACFTDKYMTSRNVLESLPSLIQFKVFCMQQANNLYWVPLSAILVQFQYELGSVINAGSYMFFQSSNFCNEMPSHYAIQQTRQCWYVSPVIFHRQRSDLSIVRDLLGIRAALFKPIFCDVFSHIEKRCSEIFAVRICASIHFTRCLRR